MADFSKQYCDLQDPGFPWDFDILEEAKKLNNNQYISIICEGFGFSAIGKDENGEILLCFRNWETEESKWEKYENVVNPRFFKYLKD